MNKVVMVAVDGSESCREAVQQGSALAVELGARLHLLHVAPLSLTDLLQPAALPGAENLLLKQVEQRLQQEGRRILNECRQEVDQPNLDVTTELLLGHPGSGICEVAEAQHVDIVVVGSRGRSTLRSLLLGSVSRFVLDHCSQPVLLVKHRP